MLKRRRWLIGCIVAPIVLFILIQLIPVWLVQNNPPVVQEPAWDSPQTRALAQRACFDCHSNETQWPLYARVAPVSWLITLDTFRGRRALNLSEWNVARSNGEGEGFGRESGREGGGGVSRQITSGAMPPWYYVLLHPSANLSLAEKQQLIQGLQASLK